MSTDLKATLAGYGVASDAIIDLRDNPEPRHVPYMDLVGDARARAAERLPDAVVEADGAAVAYVVEAGRTSLPDLRRTAKIVSLRGDAAWLAVVHPGKLELLPASLADDTVPFEMRPGPDLAHRLLYGESGAHDRPVGWVGDRIRRTFRATTTRLRERGIGPADAMSLAGRALFLRFLFDRSIVSPNEVQADAESALDVMATPDRVWSACNWLDVTFNGDLLPLRLSRAEFQGLGDAGCSALASMLLRSDSSQLHLPLPGYDFAHIPPGVLSEVYEAETHRDHRKKGSVYYTPRWLAEYVVRQAFLGIREQGTLLPHETRVIDPSCGGGVFLLAAFREIIRSWWEAHRRPPNTVELRELLYTRLVGYDVERVAVRLSALSLYLSALEHDPNPHPLSTLRFEKLEGQVLFHTGPDEEADDQTGGPRYYAGSVSGPVIERHRAAFDVVVGNPPWTTMKGDQGAQIHEEMVEAVRPVVRRVLGEDEARAFTIPSYVPDLPFVWRAMDWAREGATIAFALHARLVMCQGEYAEARRQLFSALAVSAIVNGSALRRTEVFPSVNAPWCLLFAINERPLPKSQFLYPRPVLDAEINQRGRFRVDFATTAPVSQARAATDPDLLRRLFRGSGLDARIVDRIRSRGFPSFGTYWTEECSMPSTARGGFQISKSGSRSSAALGHLRLLDSGYRGPIGIQTGSLPALGARPVQYEKTVQQFQGPILLVRRTPVEDEDALGALFCDETVAYDVAHWGYSAHGHPHARDLVRYFSVLFASPLFLWFQLLTSQGFGVERPEIISDEIEAFPVPRWESLAPGLRQELKEFHAHSKWNLAEARAFIARWVYEAYGLDPSERQTITDTLATEMAVPSVEQSSQLPAERPMVDGFCTKLAALLQPYVDRPLRCRSVNLAAREPWVRIEVGFDATSLDATDLMMSAEELADQVGASLVVHQRSGGLVVHVLNQRRYLTLTRARLLALQLVDDHIRVLREA